MANLNKVILVGNFTRDVEVRHTDSGLAYTRYTIAIDRPMNRDGNRGVDFSSCVAFGKMAENLGKLGQKGRLVYVEGHIRSRSYKDRDGNQRASMNVATNSFEILTPRANGYNNQSNANTDQSSNPAKDSNDSNDKNATTAKDKGSNESAKDQFEKNSQKVDVSDDQLPF